MGDILQGGYNKTEVWNLQGATITYNVRKRKGTTPATMESLLQAIGTDAGTLPLILNGVQTQYARNIQEQYALNKDAQGNSVKVIIEGPPQGSAVFNSIVGPGTVLEEFLDAAGDSCNVLDVMLKPFGEVKCEDTTLSSLTVTILLTDVVLIGLGFNLAIGNNGMAATNMPLNFTFAKLIYKD